MNSISEEDLIKGCIAGNRQYQKLFYQKFSKKMMGVCYRYAKNREEAEDLLQDAFVRVFTHLKSFQSRGSLEGWVRRIVVNTILESLKKKSLMFKVVDIEEALEEAGTEDLLSKVSIHDLVRLIQQLSPGYRTIFNLYAIEGYTHREIANDLGISIGTSKSQYSIARKILREHIEEQTKELSLKS